MHCKHCEAPFVLGKCRDCGLMIQDQCADCHNELAHGKVKQRTKHANGLKDRIVDGLRESQAAEIRQLEQEIEAAVDQLLRLKARRDLLIQRSEQKAAEIAQDVEAVQVAPRPSLVGFAKGMFQTREDFDEPLQEFDDQDAERFDGMS
jgi:hypothetical protein